MMLNRDLLVAVTLAFTIHAGAFVLSPCESSTPAGKEPDRKTIEVSLSRPEKPKPSVPEVENIRRKAVETKKVTKPRQKPAPKPITPPKPQPLPQPVEDFPVSDPETENGQADFQVQRTEKEEKSIRDEIPGTQQATMQEGEEKTSPSYLENPKPRYPAMARRRNIQGVVVLSVEVLPNGNAGMIEVKKSSGYSILDNAALRTVKKWRFKPATRNRTPTTAWVSVPMRFKLEK